MPPGRILPGGLGNNLIERSIPKVSLLAYTHLERALDNYGCCQLIPALIHADIFHGRSEDGFWTAEEVIQWLEDYIQVGLVEKWEAKDGNLYVFFTRWFKDNSYMQRTKPKTPRPPSLSRHITEKQWKAGEEKPFRDIYKKFKEVDKSLVNFTLDRDRDSETDIINRLYSHFKKTVNKNARLLDEYGSKIRTRLRSKQKWTEEQLVKCIDNFHAHPWYRKNCSKRSIGWLFQSDPWVDKWLQLEPTTAHTENDLRFDIAEED